MAVTKWVWVSWFPHNFLPPQVLEENWISGACLLQAGRSFYHQINSVKALNNTTTTVLWTSVWDYPGEPVKEETFTHSHLSCSSTILYQLPPSTTIHSILPAQFTCLTVFLHNLSLSPVDLPLCLEPSTSYSTHFFTELFSSLHNTCPYHRNLIAVVLRLNPLFLVSLSQLLYLKLYLLP